MSGYSYNIHRGWQPLIETAELAARAYGVEINQIKEKFGALRIYFSPENKNMSALVNQLECLSAFICEMCGEPGELRDGGWQLTLCNHHHDIREEARSVHDEGCANEGLCCS